MANFSVISYDYINFYNDAICGNEYPKDSLSTFMLADIAQVFNRYKQSEVDNIDIDTLSRGLISQYIKRILDLGIGFTDVATQRVDYKAGINKPEFIDVIDITDESISHIWTPQNIEDTLLIRTNAYIEVDYKDVESEVSTLILSDTADALISRFLTRSFKNAVYPFLSTTEVTPYTCNVSKSTILNICVCNVTLVTIKISVMVYKGGTTQTYIIKDIEIPTASSFVINNNDESAIILEEDDEIRMISDTINSADVYIALFEQS